LAAVVQFALIRASTNTHNHSFDHSYHWQSLPW